MAKKGKTHYLVTLVEDYRGRREALVEIVERPGRRSDQMLVSIEGAADKEARGIVERTIVGIYGRVPVRWG